MASYQFGMLVSMPRKTVRIHYRRFLRTGDPIISASLAASLRSALEHQIDGRRVTELYKLRTYEDPDYGTITLNGKLIVSNGDVYGEFVKFDPKANIPLLMQDADSTDELEIMEMDKPNNAEFLSGMSFFLIRRDHVFVIEQDVTNPMMERYLRWLLCTQCHVAERDARLPLVQKLALRERPDRMPNVSSMEVKPAPLPPPGLDLDEEADAVHAERRSFATNIMEILKAANIDTPLINVFMRERGASVQLNMEIVFKVGRRNIKIDGDEALAMVRNVPEGDLVLHGDGVRSNRGVLERLSDQADIERKGNILVRKDAWQALEKVANEYQDSGLIE